ncbi:MAG: hypothetical protein J6128_04585 [Clostridia bacterium]|nr:hypothetical protein [Clostridia bacterium]
MKQNKITLIGAGSVNFSLGIIRDICQTEALRGSRVCLMDINPERLEAVYNRRIRITREFGGDLALEKTLDRESALEGSDFVISTALTAPQNRLTEGMEIAKKWGFRYGGSYHVMYDEAFWINFYQFRFLEGLTRDILRICPDAWHLMVENPVISGVTLLMRKYPKVKMVGLCHGFSDVYDMAEVLGYGREDVTFEVSGVNHFIWLNSGRLKGEPLTDVLDRWIEEHGEEYWKTCGLSAVLGRKRIDFYKKHGVLAIGDTLSFSGACWPWWYHSDDETEKAFGEYSPEDAWNWYFGYVKESTAMVMELARDPDADLSGLLKNFVKDDLIVPLMESMIGNIPRPHVINTLNRGGLVPGIPEDFEVEISALCSADGIRPITATPLPKHITAHIIRDRVAPVEMELAAYESGSLEFLKELVLMDKWAVSVSQAEGFIKEILDLPYHREMKEHYR